MQLKAKYIDMESAEYTCVLHVDDAREMGVREQDRVRVKTNAVPWYIGPHHRYGGPAW